MTRRSSRVGTGAVRANGIDICYEAIGDPADPALLLIMGHGMQLDAWEMSFCQEFVARGFFLVRFDNRDVGLSTKFDGRLPDLDAARRRDPAAVVYGLEDMADDAVGLLDALGVDRAHVLGASMGGMIAQLVAIRHPDRVRSLCSIMSKTGARGAGDAKPELLAAFRSDPRQTRDEAVAAQVELSRMLCGGGFPFDEAGARVRAEHAYRRCHYPEGKLRQQAAILLAADRTAALRTLRLPTVVIHGADDPLVTISGGEATAAAIPDARLVVVPGLGHEFPPGVWSRIVAEFAGNARRSHR